MATTDPFGQIAGDPQERIRRRIMGQMDPTDSTTDTSPQPAAPFAPSGGAQPPFVPPPTGVDPPVTPPPSMTPPPGMGGNPYFNGTAWVSSGLSSITPTYGTYTPSTPTATVPAGGTAPPPPTFVPPNPIQVEPPPEIVPPNPIQIEPDTPTGPPPPIGAQPPFTVPGGTDMALNSAIRQRLRPQIGQTRTFRNGRVGRFDGKGWVHAGG